MQCPAMQPFDSVAARARGISKGYSERHAVRSAGGPTQFALEVGHLNRMAHALNIGYS